jgi:hypothetical protein
VASIGRRVNCGWGTQELVDPRSLERSCTKSLSSGQRLIGCTVSLRKRAIGLLLLLLECAESLGKRYVVLLLLLLLLLLLYSPLSVNSLNLLPLDPSTGGSLWRGRLDLGGCCTGGGCAGGGCTGVGCAGCIGGCPRGCWGRSWT